MPLPSQNSKRTGALVPTSALMSGARAAAALPGGAAARPPTRSDVPPGSLAPRRKGRTGAGVVPVAAGWFDT